MLRVTLWSFMAMLLTGLLAVATQRPFIFPSLGPSALLIFGHPEARTAAPKHVVFGHAIGAGCGYFALWTTGLLGIEYSAHVSPHRVIALGIALALTAFFTVAFRVEHAPAGATTLIVAFGLLPRIEDFLWLMAAIVILALLGWSGNRISRVDYPVWSRDRKP
jgi:CBS domain-containing membrane protein